MKVLIISHNVISNNSNMGKTMKAYFNDFNSDEIAQLYIHSEIPTDDTICKNYYRFTDIDALKSVFSFKQYGTHFSQNDIKSNAKTSRIDTGAIRNIYQLGRERTATIYLARNILWECSHWFTDSLKQWLNDFSPDIIFFASGDYAFMYEIVFKISNYLNIPFVISCYDDYYINNTNEHSLLGKFTHKYLLKKAFEAFDKAEFATVVSQPMSDDYSKLFNKKCYILYTGAELESFDLSNNADKISYLGNISNERCVQLSDMGKALLSLKRTEEPKMIDVYSAETNPEYLALMNEKNGIRFHGFASPEKVKCIMQNSMAVIHTESFDQYYNNLVKYSISTKIAESLANGPCIIAYGPVGIASIDYLKNNNVAFCINSKTNLKDELKRIIEDESLRMNILKNARRLAVDNHDVIKNGKMLRQWLEEALSDKEDEEI